MEKQEILSHCWVREFNEKGEGSEDSDEYEFDERRCTHTVYYLINGEEKKVDLASDNRNGYPNVIDKIYLGAGKFSRSTSCRCENCERERYERNNY